MATRTISLYCDVAVRNIVTAPCLKMPMPPVPEGGPEYAN